MVRAVEAGQFELNGLGREMMDCLGCSSRDGVEMDGDILELAVENEPMLVDGDGPEPLQTEDEAALARLDRLEAVGLTALTLLSAVDVGTSPRDIVDNVSAEKDLLDKRTSERAMRDLAWAAGDLMLLGMSTSLFDLIELASFESGTSSSSVVSLSESDRSHLEVEAATEAEAIDLAGLDCDSLSKIGSDCTRTFTFVRSGERTGRVDSRFALTVSLIACLAVSSLAGTDDDVDKDSSWSAEEVCCKP